MENPIISSDGTKAVDGTKAWYLNGQRHRIDGPAIEWADGTKEWYLNGKRHRTDGPAWEWVGSKEWYINGHRLSPEQIVIAQKIIANPKWINIPLYINDPLLAQIIISILKK